MLAPSAYPDNNPTALTFEESDVGDIEIVSSKKKFSPSILPVNQGNTP